MSSLSKLDAVYRSILLAKFFTKGWGTPDNLKRLFAFRKIISNRETCQHLVAPDYPITIDKIEKHPQYEILDGHFVSPFVHHLPEVVPEESRIARFQMILPKQWPAEPYRPICLHLAGTGDHFYWKRRILMARPLLKAGIGSILLENPFYGSRKPKAQVRSSLHNVSDIFVMGGCLILESLALFHWCEKQGFGPLGISGISMGGHMASLAGCNWHKPIPIIPCLSWSTASCVFTQGVMSGAIPWSLLQNQYSSDNVYQDEIQSMVHSPEQSDAFHAGVHFSRTYPKSMAHMQHLAAQGKDNILTNQTDVNTELLNKDLLSPPTSSASEQIISSIHLKKPSPLSSMSKQNPSKSSESMFSTGTSNQKETKDQLKNDAKLLKVEALNFMSGMMDECTHLGNFSIPVDPSLSIVVTAKHDAYVPRDGIKSIEDLWPGCEIRYIDAGHISAFLFNHNDFRKAVIDAFEKTTQKYHGGSILCDHAKVILGRDANL